MKLNNNSDFDTIMLLDAGIETELVFKHDIDLPGFATFPLMDCVDRWTNHVSGMDPSLCPF
jgi:hypothetical protein